MSDDLYAFDEAIRTAAHRSPWPQLDPKTEQAVDDAVIAARPRTHSHMRELLETRNEADWAALLDEDISPGLGTFGAMIEILVRTRAQYETVARLGDAFEEQAATEFAEAITSHDGGNAEVRQVAKLMLADGWFTTADVEQLSARAEEVTAVAIAAIRDHDLGTVPRKDLGEQFHLAMLKLLLS